MIPSSAARRNRSILCGAARPTAAYSSRMLLMWSSVLTDTEKMGNLNSGLSHRIQLEYIAFPRGESR